MNKKYTKVLKTFNLLLIIAMSIFGLYSVLLAVLLTANFSIILVFPTLGILIREPMVTIFLNIIYLLIIILSLSYSFRAHIGKIDKAIISIPEFIPIMFFIALIVELLTPIKQPTMDASYVAVLLLIAPIYEEIFFRLFLIVIPIVLINSDFRIILSGKRDINFIDVAFLAISSIIFGFLHGYMGFGAIVIATTAGFILSYISLRYTILSSITMHFLLNSPAATILIASYFSHGHILTANTFILTIITLLGIPNLVYLALYLLNK